MAMAAQELPKSTGDYEYVPVKPSQQSKLILIIRHSYETLPPNYSIGDNMLAGAFAGIAVSAHIIPSWKQSGLSDATPGAYGLFSRRPLEGRARYGNGLKIAY